MNKIYDIISKRTGGKFDGVRFARVSLGRRGAVVKVICRDEDYAKTAQCRDELKTLLTEECGFHANISVEIEAVDTSARAVREIVAEFIGKFPYMTAAATDINATDSSVKIKMHKSMLDLAKEDFLPRLAVVLENSFVDKIKIETEIVELKSSVADDGTVYMTQKPKQEEEKEIRYDVETVRPIWGEITENNVLSAGSVKGNNDDITVCGILVMPTEFMSKGGGAKRSRPYEKFLLYDGSRTLQCRFFPRDGFSLLDANVLNKPVCAFGNTEVERGRTGEIAMTVRALCECNAVGLNLLKAVPKPKKYITVKPKEYSEFVQASLFDGGGELPQSLKGTFVAFDFETTGLSIFYDKPTELGAVKIVDGVITETFSTLIDPQRPIPPEVSDKTGITDDMVRGQPLFEEVIPDFYRFSHGAALIGHNIAFDFPFLIKYGNACGYAFGDRATYDTLGIAPRAISGIDNLTLDNVLGNLGLVNDNAHRAQSDALATAKAFIAMQKRLATAD